jgi:hypothetical protein
MTGAADGAWAAVMTAADGARAAERAAAGPALAG